MRILVVDDDRLLRDMLARLLSVVGHEAECATDGQDARGILCASAQWDLVITDCDMPREKGIELLGAIRAGETAARADLPVIMISGNDHESEATAAGAGFLEKPFVIDDLLRLVEQAA